MATLFEADDPGLQLSYDPAQPLMAKKREEPEPSWGATIMAAARLENPIMNVLDQWRRPEFEPDPEFDLQQVLKQRGLWEVKEDYYGVRSQPEFDFLTGKREREAVDRETLARSGAFGIAALIASGLIDPTIFLPIVGPVKRVGSLGKGIAVVMEGMALGTAGAAGSEAVLQGNQVTRSLEEGAWSVAPSTFLGGLLGAGIARAGAKELARMRANVTDTSQVRIVPAVGADGQPLGSGHMTTEDSSLGPAGTLLGNVKHPTSLGAAAEQVAALEDAGRLLRKDRLTGKVIDAIAQSGPVYRSLDQIEDVEGRRIMHQLGTGGLKTERAVPVPGGDVTSATEVRRGMPKVTGKRILQDGYSDYAMVPEGRFRQARTIMGSISKPVERQSRADWEHEVARGIRRYGLPETVALSDIPEAAKAAERLVSEVYRPAFDEAWNTGVYKELAAEGMTQDDVFRASLLTFDRSAIDADGPQLRQLFVDNITRQNKEELRVRRIDHLEGVKQSETEEADLLREGDDARETIKKMLEERKALDEEMSEALKEAEKLQAKIDVEDDPRLKSAFKEALARLRGGPKFKQRTNLQRRVDALNKNATIVADRQEAIRGQVEAIEEAQIATLGRVIREGQKFLAEAKSMTNTNWRKASRALIKDIEKASNKLKESQDKVEKVLAQEDTATADLVGRAEEVVAVRQQKLDDLVTRLKEMETFDREAWTQAIGESLDDFLARANDINNARAVRAQKLLDRAGRLDPERTAKEVKNLQRLRYERDEAFHKRMHVKGVREIDLATGEADFLEGAGELADELMIALKETPLSRLNLNDLMLEPKGKLFAKALDMEPDLLDKFLDKDPKEMLRRIIDSQAADTSLAEKELDGPNLRQAIKDMHQRREDKLKAVHASDLAPKAKQKRMLEVARTYKQLEEDINTVVTRIKRTRGPPSDPQAFAMRGVKMIRDFNNVRNMPAATIASIPDPAGILMKHGLLNTFKDGFVPFALRLQGMDIMKSNAHLANVGLEVELNHMGMAFSDIIDDAHKGTMFERGLHYASNKVGLLNGLDWWTQTMKRVGAVTDNAEITRDIETFITGKGNVAEATKRLNYKNINGDDATVIWEQMTNGVGGENHRGVWFPAIKDWDRTIPRVKRAAQSYLAALYKGSTEKIMTPGPEKPSFMDASIVGHLAVQHRSFAFGAYQKIFGALVQERDIKSMWAVVTYLGLGYMSYWTWAHVRGGEDLEKFKRASPGDLADEAIARSGLLGVMGEVQMVLQGLPLTAPYAGFGEGSRAFRGGDPVDIVRRIGGPTVGLAQDLTRILAGIHDPTQTTVRQISSMMPYRKLWWLHRGGNQIEEFLGSSLPERRGQ